MAIDVLRYSEHRSERMFFSSLALLILLSTFIGFARTYYLAGLFHAPLPNVLVHVHGAVFSCWVLLLVAQVSLIAAGRADVHRKLGLLGIGLAGVLIVLGIWTATDTQVRHFVGGDWGPKVRASYALSLNAIFVFATLIYFAMRNRYDPSTHKRLVILATLALLDAALLRFPIPAAWGGHRAASYVGTVLLVLLIAGYDYWSRGRIHRATISGGLFLVTLQHLRGPIGLSAPFQAFTVWVVTHASAFNS